MRVELNYYEIFLPMARYKFKKYFFFLYLIKKNNSSSNEKRRKLEEIFLFIQLA